MRTQLRLVASNTISALCNTPTSVRRQDGLVFHSSMDRQTTWGLICTPRCIAIHFHTTMPLKNWNFLKFHLWWNEFPSTPILTTHKRWLLTHMVLSMIDDRADLKNLEPIYKCMNLSLESNGLDVEFNDDIDVSIAIFASTGLNNHSWIHWSVLT